jgi:hypothetical protein
MNNLMARRRADEQREEEYLSEMQGLYGLRPSRAAVCLRPVAGKRCLLGYSHQVVCICQAPWMWRVLDHPRIWLNRDREYVLTGEPYQGAFSDEELAGFERAVKELGLVYIRGGGPSPYSPGHTELIRVVRARPVAVHLT